jgi:hypothetical protein
MKKEIIKTTAKKLFTLEDMRKSYIAGGKMARDMANPSFEEFIEILKQPKCPIAKYEKAYAENRRLKKKINKLNKKLKIGE